MGRPKGSGNKPLKRLLIERLREKFPDYDPVMEQVAATIKMKTIAEDTNDIHDLKLLHDSLNQVSRFFEPTLKAVEVSTGDDGLLVQVNRKRFDGSKPDIDTEQ
ncbi:MAG: hypothetical protein P8P29_08460 [Flavobacteriaceae bacterium]|nr:hypothetical protein [Flavobacteriaceae bacterium]